MRNDGGKTTIFASPHGTKLLYPCYASHIQSLAEAVMAASRLLKLGAGPVGAALLTKSEVLESSQQFEYFQSDSLLPVVPGENKGHNQCPAKISPQRSITDYVLTIHVLCPALAPSKLLWSRLSRTLHQIYPVRKTQAENTGKGIPHNSPCLISSRSRSELSTQLR